MLMYGVGMRGGLAAGCLAWVFAMVVSGTAMAAGSNADPEGFWADIAEDQIVQRGERWVSPAQYRAVSLDYAALQTHLARAPMENLQQRLADSTTQLSLPHPSGGYADFAIVESPVMAPELAAKYPSIRTYAGQGISDPTASLRLDVTPVGFHAQVLSAQGDYYIDPFQAEDNEHYVSYLRRHAGDNTKQYRCGVDGHDHGEVSALDGVVPNNPSGANLRTYRIAIAATSAYTNTYGGTVANGLGGIVTSVNRISGIYEREIAIRLVLVANNDLIVYTTENPGPLPNPPSPNATLQSTIDNAIGAANYDIGHAFGTGNGGSITPLGNVCGTQKAQGITAFNPPRGDIFDIDFTAHELGHQLGGNHTWNGCGGGGQWTASSAMEPGSGTTIMAYAGICPDNLMPNSDAFFHARSFTQIFQIINNGGPGNGNTVCGTVAATGNTPPNITAPANLTIPERTPFQLTATGSDPDVGEVLTYNWEQVDTGAQGSPSTTGDNGTAPLFRSFYATTSPTRIFPSLIYILDNANVPPATITLPPAGGTYLPGEILPNPASGTRLMNFRVTARDNRIGAGGLRHAQMQVTAVAAAGPFSVANITGPLAGGSNLAVTWVVAGTDAAPINTSQVNILISQDGGYTFNTLLAGTANDGSETVTLPTTATARARIRVEAANGSGVAPGNTYFDITDANFAITDAGSAVTIAVSTAAADLISIKQGSPAPASENIATISGGTAPYTATADTYPSNPEISIQNILVSGTTVSATAAATCQVAAPNAPSFRTYPAVLKVSDAAGRVASAVFPINVSNNDIPTLGTYSNQPVAPGGSVTASPSTGPGDPNGNYVGISVSPTTLPGGGTVSVDAAGVVTVNTVASTTLGSYPIRVSVTDTCRAQGTQQFTLNVVSANPVLAVNGTAVTSGNNVIEPNECNTLDVTLGNSGGSAATAIGTTLSTTTPGVTITQNSSTYPNIASGGTGLNDTDYQISTDATVVCGSNIALTQTVNYTGGGSPSTFSFSLPVGTPPAANYSFASSTGAAPVTGSTLLAGSLDDDVVLPVTLPSAFAFSIYDTPVTQLRLSTNGVLLFNTAGGSSTAGNAALPSGTFTTPTLFAFWDDLDMRAVNVTNGGIFTSVSGSSPNRIFDIEWRAAIFRNSTPSPLPAPTVVFTIRLHESSNLMEIIYSNVTGNGGANGSSATVGIQAAGTGTAFTQYSFNSASLSAGQKLSLARAAGICNPGPGFCGFVPDPIFMNGFE